MKPQYITDLPLGYENAVLGLTENNEVIADHSTMPPIIYDETVMRWVPVNTIEVNNEP